MNHRLGAKGSGLRTPSLSSDGEGAGGGEVPSVASGTADQSAINSPVTSSLHDLLTPSKRSLLIAALVAAACTAPAQVDITTLLRGGIDILQREGKLPIPAGSNYEQDALEPKGHDGLPGRSGELPPPQAGTQKLDILRHGPMRSIGNRMHITGGVHLRYRGYDIMAEEVEGSLDTNIFTATGNVRVIGQDATITGDRVTVNLDERTFRAENADAQLRPSFLQGRVLDDLYLKGGVSYGSEREVWGEHTSFTTCNLDHPHYQLIGARSNIRPGRRAILRHVDIEILHRKILRIPFVSIPLDNTGDKYLPEVGQTPDEGYYIKNRLGVPIRGDDGLFARVDYMTKLGAGLGGDYRYERSDVRGLLNAYAIFGKIDTLNAQNEHEQRIGSGILRLTNNFQRNNYLNAPQNTLLNSMFSYQLPQGQGTTSLFAFNRNSNEGGGFRSLNQTYALADERKWSSKTTTRAFVNLVQNSSGPVAGTPVEREQLDVRFNARHQLSKALAELEYIRSIPVGETVNFFSPSDRTPVLALKSDARLLFGEAFSRRLPFQTELSIGEFVSRASDKITRSNFDFNFSRPDRSGNRSRLNLNGRFKQGIYSDDTAQYVTGLGVDYGYRLGPDTEAKIRYNFLRSYGFTPVSIDRVGRTNFLSADVNVRPLRSLIFGAGTGYDFIREEREEVAWQTASLRAEYTPADWFIFRAYSTYDPIQHAFNSLRLDFAYFPGATRVTAGFRYDGIRHTWGNANLLIDGLKWGRLNISSLLSYNGYLKKFEARHFSFTYDLHCAEAILQIIDNPTGFRSGRQISFFLRLKALPFDTPFGTGTRGQPVNGMGTMFGGGG